MNCAGTTRPCINYWRSFGASDRQKARAGIIDRRKLPTTIPDRMNPPGLENLTAVLQASIAPVALISGVGLLILSLTNRLGRVMDRLRQLIAHRRSESGADTHVDVQITVLHRRAKILKGSLTAAVLCTLLTSALVLLLFTMAVFGAELELLVVALFAASLLSLIVSLILFSFDMNQSLRAVEQELLR